MQLWHVMLLIQQSALCCWISNKATVHCSANFFLFFLLCELVNLFWSLLLLAHLSWWHVRFAAAVQKQKGNEMGERCRLQWFSCHYLRRGIEEPKSPKCLASFQKQSIKLSGFCRLVCCLVTSFRLVWCWESRNSADTHRSLKPRCPLTHTVPSQINLSCF